MRAALLLGAGVFIGVALAEAAKPPPSPDEIIAHAKRLEFHFAGRDWICFRKEEVPEALR